jgi:hypothetical protein
MHISPFQSLQDAVISRASPVVIPLPQVSPVPPEIASLISTTNRNLALGVLRIAALLFVRPFVAYVLFKFLTRKCSSGAFKVFVGAASIACSCAPTTVCRALGISGLFHFGTVKPGVFTYGPGSPGSILSARSNLMGKVGSYFSYVNGELSTILPAIAGEMRKSVFELPPGFQQQTVNFESSCSTPTDDVELFATDWIFPTRLSSSSKNVGVCILLAGVGGDSSASYLREVAGGMHENGWVTCAINARGVGNFSPPVKVPINRALAMIKCTAERIALFMLCRNWRIFSTRILAKVSHSNPTVCTCVCLYSSILVSIFLRLQLSVVFVLKHHANWPGLIIWYFW